MNRVMEVTAAGAVTFAVTSSGHVFSWGCHNFGGLGLGAGVKQVGKPHLLQKLVQTYRAQIRKVSVSATHTLFLAASGQLYATGKGDMGQLAMTLESIQRKSTSDFSNAGKNDLAAQSFNLGNI